VVVNRQHPILSPVAFLSAVLLMAGIGASVLLSGGAAFSPGPLTRLQSAAIDSGGFESHAAFANDCQQCHTPMAGVDATRCERCHTGVAEQRASGAGLHSRLPDVTACARCHPDHQGQDFDTAAAGRDKFDHALTGFSLVRHVQDYAGAVVECHACHAGRDFDFAVAGCVSCHHAQDPEYTNAHTAAFGGGCLACHDGLDQSGSFDHAATSFALEGAHATAACGACHTADRPAAETPLECGACHAEPPVHAGLFSADCAECHNDSAWSPARWQGQDFAHASTKFALTTHTALFDGAQFTCAGCHANASADPEALAPAGGDVCATCHALADPAFMTEHMQTFGLSCLGCHDGSGRQAVFDHSQFFVLDGAHAPLACEACHADQRFDGTPAECAGCHAEPEMHAGVFGTDCAACHTTGAWVPAALREHTFPLDHGEQGELACATCHTEAYPAYTCYGCHEHNPEETQREHTEEGITAERLSACAECHPNGEEEDE
jgi:hypothetical protein